MKTGMLAITFVGMMAALGTGVHEHRAVPTTPDPICTTRSPFAAAMDAGMQRLMDDMHASGYSGNADVDFLAMMIPHHEGAIEMARLALVHGEDPLTRRLAEEIIASQTVEISAMRQRLALLRRNKDPNPDGFPTLHGTRGTAPTK
jgi:uncharacterized protein (DUF305 family)